MIETAARKVPGLSIRPVEYLTLTELRRKRIAASKLPFLKRYAFQPEDEVRLVWESKSEERTSLPVSINLSSIVRVTLSPWLHPSLSDEVKALLKSIDGCSRVEVVRSTLISNAEWMKHGAAAL